MTADMTMNQVLGIWSELEQCYYGQNGYGGDVAEIYAYRLVSCRPAAQMIPPDTLLARQAREEQAVLAGQNLYWLLKKFKEDRSCDISINAGHPITELLTGFEHRCHVRVWRDKKWTG